MYIYIFLMQKRCLSDAKEISLSLSHPASQIFQDVAQPALSLNKDSRATAESV